MAQDQLRGVNLGGWLVLEKWMTPSLFKGTRAADEFTLCEKLGDNKAKIIKKHRDTFITEEDFKWIAEQGMNAVRLPVGYWVFGNRPPFVKSESYVEKALDWAEKYELRVILDLHTAPGSQNGEMHSGKAGEIGWHSAVENIDHTVDVIAKIAETFGKRRSLYGIELLNEPSKEIPFSVLRDFYEAAYNVVRSRVPESVYVIISDAYRPLAEWEDFIKSLGRTNLLLDAHMYQLFSDEDKKLTFDGHINKTFKWKRQLEAFGADKLIIGEWTANLDSTYSQMDSSSARAAQYLYEQAQAFAFQNCKGTFYWNYKTEGSDAWSFRHTRR